jgi:hypothetical protein
MSNYSQIDSEMHFQPWIGTNYPKGINCIKLNHNPAPRLHLLGESHYIKPGDNSPLWTIEAVENWALGNDCHKAFWTKAISTVEGLSYRDFSRQEAWQKVAFSNFIQDHLSKPREAIPQEFWQRGSRCFLAQLALTKPDILIVLGKRLFLKLPREQSQIIPHFGISDNFGGVSDALTYRYDVDGESHETIAVSIIHPSSSHFNRSAATKRVQAVLRSINAD